MAILVDIFFVFGLTLVVYLITDTLFLIVAISSSPDQYSTTSTRTPKNKNISGLQKPQPIVAQVQISRSRQVDVNENVVGGGDQLVVDQLHGIVENSFDEMPLRVEVVEDGENAEIPQRVEVVEDDENVDTGCDLGNAEKENEEEGWLEEWEGIESSELDRRFGAAVAFVGSKTNATRVLGIESNVKMELYALQKVSIEGPCIKPPPMAFKVFARAKWNAWKQLEDMSREEAMEEYIALLSRTIPDWMEDDTTNAGTNEPCFAEHNVVGAIDRAQSCT